MTRAEIAPIILRFARQYPVPDDKGYESSYLDRCEKELRTATPDKLREAAESFCSEPHRRARPTPDELAERCGLHMPSYMKPAKEPLFDKPTTPKQASNLKWVRNLIGKMAKRHAEIEKVGRVTLPDGRCVAADRVPVEAREPGEDDR